MIQEKSLHIPFVLDEPELYGILALADFFSFFLAGKSFMFSEGSAPDGHDRTDEADIMSGGGACVRLTGAGEEFSTGLAHLPPRLTRLNSSAGTSANPLT